MDYQAIIVCILSSSAAATAIAAVKELIIWRLNRKAKKADEKELKEDTVSTTLDNHQDDIKDMKDAIKDIKEDLKDIHNQMKATVKHDKVILRDKIKYLISKYIEYGEITLDEKQAIQHMWNIYHYDLGGNGDLNDWMELLEEIPVKQGAGVVHYPHIKEEG